MFPGQSFFDSVKEKIPESFSLSNLQRNSYAPVKADDYQHDEPDPLPRRKQTLLGTARELFAQTSRRLLLSVAGLLFLLILAGTFLPSSRSKPIVIQAQKHNKLFLFIPVFGADTARCRTELTAAVLGYPTPRLAGLEDKFNEPGMHAERQHEKIRNIHNYLVSMGDDRDTDIMILLDGPHSWFQLRAEVLLTRYYQIIERASDRLQKSMGSAAAQNRTRTPKVVFSAQNHCSGHTLDEIACFAAPNNPIDSTSNFRYPSAGMAVGPIKELRDIFTRMNEKAEKEKDDVQAHTLLGEIFGEQEFHREVVRQGEMSSTKKKLASVVKALGYGKSVTDDVPGRELLENSGDVKYEMGIALDYGNELGLSVDHTTRNTEWVQHNSTAQEGYRSTPLPREIQYSMPPYWTMTQTKMPAHKGWKDVLLLADKRTSSIPAVINFEWDTKETPYLQSLEGWSKFWMHGHTRKLFEMQAEIPRLPLTTVVDGNATEHTFWNQEIRLERQGGIKLDGGWDSWNDHCEWAQGEIIAKEG